MKTYNKKIILFRFHKEFEICKNRLEMLKFYNPNIDIYGIFGGEEKDLNKAHEILDEYLKNIYQVPDKDMRWNWYHSDLAIREWYKNFSRNIDFDILHLIEWDLILFDSLDNLYKHIPADGLGLTALVPIKDVKDKWDWVAREPHKSDRERMMKYVKEELGYKDEPYGCLGPGPFIPRDFLEKYLKLEIPEFPECNDELRFPIFGQILGFKLYDTGFRNWLKGHEKKYFNCHDREIKESVIKKELSKADGRRVFHPYRKIIDYKNIKA